jgi:hypothetical protein
LNPGVTAASSSSHGIHCPFRVRRQLRTIVSVESSHFAVEPSLGLVVFRSRRIRKRSHIFRKRLSSGSVFLQSLTRLILAAADTRKHHANDSSHELRFPSALSSIEDPLPRVCLTRFGPPSGFDYPPDGFRPSTPGRPCFMPTALLGFLTPFEAFPSRKVPRTITSRR